MTILSPDTQKLFADYRNEQKLLGSLPTPEQAQAEYATTRYRRVLRFLAQRYWTFLRPVSMSLLLGFFLFTVASMFSVGDMKATEIGQLQEHPVAMTLLALSALCLIGSVIFLGAGAISIPYSRAGRQATLRVAEQREYLDELRSGIAQSARNDLTTLGYHVSEMNLAELTYATHQGSIMLGLDDDQLTLLLNGSPLLESYAASANAHMSNSKIITFDGQRLATVAPTVMN